MTGRNLIVSGLCHETHNEGVHTRKVTVTKFPATKPDGASPSSPGLYIRDVGYTHGCHQLDADCRMHDPVTPERGTGSPLESHNSEVPEHGLDEVAGSAKR